MRLCVNAGPTSSDVVEKFASPSKIESHMLEKQPPSPFSLSLTSFFCRLSASFCISLSAIHNHQQPTNHQRLKQTDQPFDGLFKTLTSIANTLGGPSFGNKKSFPSTTGWGNPSSPTKNHVRCASLSPASPLNGNQVNSILPKGCQILPVMLLLDRVVGRTSGGLTDIPSECKTSSRMQQQSDPVSMVAVVM
jgi:hypothetical protein